MCKDSHKQKGDQIMAETAKNLGSAMTIDQQSMVDAIVADTLAVLIRCEADIEAAKNLASKAINGLAGFVCSRQGIAAAIEVLEKMPEKAAKKYAALLEIACGYFHSKEEKEGKFIVFKNDTPLFKFSKKSGVICTIESLLTGSKKQRHTAYQKLCKNRLKLPEDLTQVTIKAIPRENDADSICKSFKALATKAQNSWNNWQDTENAALLQRILDFLAMEKVFERKTTGAKDRAVTAATTGKGGRPKIK